MTSRVGSERGDSAAVLARLRALVAYLGEAGQFGWWRTSFLSPTGRRYLEFNFPRTVLSAAVTAASHAARQLHDRSIATSGAHHLFRLPHDLEVRVHAHLVEHGSGNLLALIESRGAALEALVDLANGDGSRAGVGPFRVAATSRITHRPSLRRMASAYAGAFAGADCDPVFPYFTDE